MPVYGWAESGHLAGSRRFLVTSGLVIVTHNPEVARDAAFENATDMADGLTRAEAFAGGRPLML
jgi:hypothetical protein